MATVCHHARMTTTPTTTRVATTPTTATTATVTTTTATTVAAVKPTLHVGIRRMAARYGSMQVVVTARLRLVLLAAVVVAALTAANGMREMVVLVDLMRFLDGF